MKMAVFVTENAFCVGLLLGCDLDENSCFPLSKMRFALDFLMTWWHIAKANDDVRPDGDQVILDAARVQKKFLAPCASTDRQQGVFSWRSHAVIFSSSVRTRSKPPNWFFFSRIRFSFRIFKMRGFVSPAVHHSNAYPAQSCKSATLTRVTTGSQHDFIMPWCKDDTIYQNSRLCIVKFSYSPSQEDTQQIIQLYLLGLKD